VENEEGQVIVVVILHPQGKVFEIEDFHIKMLSEIKKP